MRKAFVQSLIQLAGADERVILLTGDLGYLVIEEFVEKFPKQFFNMGVAEQNMLGVATGLAEAGFIPLSIRSPLLQHCAPLSLFAMARFITSCRCGLSVLDRAWNTASMETATSEWRMSVCCAPNQG